MLTTLLLEFIRLRSVVLFIALMLLLSGAWRLSNLKIDLYPEFAGPRIEIQTEAQGLPAAEVEAFITVPLEEMLSGIPWVQSMQSRSVAGVSSIVLHLEADANIMNVRQMTQERLTRASALPKVSKPPTMLQPVSSQNRSNIVGLSSSSMPLIEMSVLARWKVKPRLLGVPGVANVSIWGERSRQLQVLVDPERLKTLDVSLSEVIKATGDSVWSSPLTFLQASTPGNGGFIDTPNQRFDIRHVLPISSAGDLAKVNFLSAKGQRYSLGDVASVVEGHQPLIGDAVVGGKTGLMIVIEKFPGVDTGEVTHGIEKAFAALAPALPGVDIDTSLYRPASYIEMAQSNLVKTGLIGLCLAVAFLFLFTFDWRRTAVAALPVAVAMASALFVLQVAAVPFNAMVIVGLGMALAFSISEMLSATSPLVHAGRGEEARRKSAALPAVVAAAAANFESRSLALFCTLAAGATLLLLTDTVAVLWKPAIIAFLVGIAMSFLVSLFMVPSLVMISGLATHGGSQTKSVRASVESWLARMVQRSFGRGRAMLLLAGLASLIVLATAYLLPKDVVPDFQERGFVIRLDTAPGVSLARMRQDVDKITNAVKAVPGITTVAAQIGRAELSDRLSDVNIAELWLGMDSSAEVEEILTAVGETIAKNIDASRQRVIVDSYSAMKIAENVAIIRAPVEVRLNGPGGKQLDQLTDDIKTLLASVPGLAAPRIAEQAVEKHIEIEVDLAAAAQYGLKPGDVRRAASTLVSGLQVGTLFEGQKIFDVVVQGTPETHASIEKIGKLLISAPGGKTIALDQVANVRLNSSPSGFLREGASRYSVITAEVSEGSVSTIRGEVGKRLAAFQFPAGFHAELMTPGIASAMNNPGILAGTAAVLIGLFLAALACIGGWRRTSLLFLLAPAALFGSIAVPLAEGVIGAGHVAGFAVLAALAFGGLLAGAEREGALKYIGQDDAASAAASVHAASGNLAALAMILGLAVAIVIVGEIAGLELFHSMVYVIIAGFPTLLVYLLVVVPAAVRGTATDTVADTAIPAQDPVHASV